MKTIGHLVHLLKKQEKGSGIESLMLPQSKCPNLIKNVISPYFLEKIVQDIGTNFY